MDFISPAAAARVVFSLGIVNIGVGLLIFFSCRCIATGRLTKGWMKNKKFLSFYKYHCYLWWFIWPSVIVHAFFVISLVGVPF